MPTLEQISTGDTISERKRYTNYVLACQEQGVPPLRFEDWIKAGSPSGPK